MGATAELRFADFEVSLGSGELRRNGVRVKLQGQPFQILVLLLERHGELVSREEIRQKLWTADTFVDFDNGLNIAVNKLRTALSDDADAPRFIETLPRRGYRFVAPVTAYEFRAQGSSNTFDAILPAAFANGGPRTISEFVPEISQEQPEQRFQSATERREWLRDSQNQAALETLRRPLSGWSPTRRYATAVLAIGTLLAAGLIMQGRWWRQFSAKQVVVRQLTANSPENPVISAFISPDGTRLAYSDRTKSVSLLKIDTGETASYPDLNNFRVSGWLGPEHLVLIRNAPGTWTLSLFDRTVTKLADDSQQIVASADGEQWAFLKADAIWVGNREGTERRVVSPDDTWSIDTFQWAPNGKRLVFLEDRVVRDSRSTDSPHHEVRAETCDLQGGSRTILLSNAELHGEILFSPLEWLPDGRIIFGLNEASHPYSRDMNLWTLRVDPDTGLPHGKPARLTDWSGFSSYSTSSSHDGRRVAVLRFRIENSIRIAELDGGGIVGMPQGLKSDNWPHEACGWSSNGQAILIVATPYGKQGIFLQSVTDGTIKPLVLGTENYDSPAITADGRWLLYTEHPKEGSPRLMRRALDGGTPALVLEGLFSYHCSLLGSGTCVLAETRGKRVAFSTFDVTTGQTVLFATVDADSSVVFRHGWSISADGRRIAVLDHDGERALVINVTDGKQQVITPKGWEFLQSVSWSSDGSKLFVSGTLTSSDDWSIGTMDLAGDSHLLLDVPSDRAWLHSPMPSPDGHFLVFTQKSWDNDTVLLENF